MLYEKKRQCQIADMTMLSCSSKYSPYSEVLAPSFHYLEPPNKPVRMFIDEKQEVMHKHIDCIHAIVTTVLNASKKKKEKRIQDSNNQYHSLQTKLFTYLIKPDYGSRN